MGDGAAMGAGCGVAPAQAGAPSARSTQTIERTSMAGATNADALRSLQRTRPACRVIEAPQPVPQRRSRARRRRGAEPRSLRALREPQREGADHAGAAGLLARRAGTEYAAASF